MGVFLLDQIADAWINVSR